MQVVFVIVEFKISNFFAVMQFNRRQSQIARFLSIWQVFRLGTFLVAMYLHVFQINHKPSVPQMGGTKMHF